MGFNLETLPGDVILDTNRQPVKSAKDAVEKLKKAKKGNLYFSVLRGENTILIFMEVG